MKQKEKISRLRGVVRRCERDGKKAQSKEATLKLDILMERIKTEHVAGCGKLAIYQVWRPETGALHSEPIFDSERIFMSVVPGPVEGLSRFVRNPHFAKEVSIEDDEP